MKKQVQLIKVIDSFDQLTYPEDFQAVLRGDAYWFNPIKYNEKSEPSILEKSYLAGFLDGEGSIGIYKRSDTKSYYLAVSAHQKNPEPLLLLKKYYGGTITEIIRRDYRQGFEWRVGNNLAYYLILDLVDFLIVKKSEALIALEFQNDMIQYGKSRKSEDIKDKRKRWYEEIKELKHRNFNLE